MRISDWSSDVCPSDLTGEPNKGEFSNACRKMGLYLGGVALPRCLPDRNSASGSHAFPHWRSEEHTSELQSLMRISYAVFCLKKKNKVNPLVYNQYTPVHLFSIKQQHE